MVILIYVVEEIVPHIIEPSFGFGRVLYGLLEQSYYSRDEKRSVLKINPHMAPIQCAVLPLFNNEQFVPIAEKLSRRLKTFGIHTHEDYSSTTIGKRYVRVDEVGAPFCITIDHQTLEDNTATLRERDSLEQVRIKLEELPEIMKKLTNGYAYMEDEEFKGYGWTWASVKENYPLFVSE